MKQSFTMRSSAPTGRRSVPIARLREPEKPNLLSLNRGPCMAQLWSFETPSPSAGLPKKVLAQRPRQEAPEVAAGRRKSSAGAGVGRAYLFPVRGNGVS
jgi:hypothetical protein